MRNLPYWHYQRLCRRGDSLARTLCTSCSRGRSSLFPFVRDCDDTSFDDRQRACSLAFLCSQIFVRTLNECSAVSACCSALFGRWCSATVLCKTTFGRRSNRSSDCLRIAGRRNRRWRGTLQRCRGDAFRKWRHLRVPGQRCGGKTSTHTLATKPWDVMAYALWRHGFCAPLEVFV